MIFGKVVNKVKYICREITVYLGVKFFNVDISTISRIDFYIKLRDKERKYKCKDRLVTLDDYCGAVFSYFSPNLVNMVVVTLNQRIQTITLGLPELKGKPDLLVACDRFMQERRLLTIRLYVGAFDCVGIIGSIDYGKVLVDI